MYRMHTLSHALRAGNHKIRWDWLCHLPSHVQSLSVQALQRRSARLVRHICQQSACRSHLSTKCVSFTSVNKVRVVHICQQSACRSHLSTKCVSVTSVNKVRVGHICQQSVCRSHMSTKCVSVTSVNKVRVVHICQQSACRSHLSSKCVSSYHVWWWYKNEDCSSFIRYCYL